MINYQTILSNYNERGTLLKWLRTLQTALEEGALETVTTTTTDDSVVFHFGFANGTSLDSPPIQLEAGPQGPEGPEGPEGPQGPAATISIGSVTTLPAGSSATVVNSGTSGAAVFDFGLPEGDTGPQGEDGPQGPAATVAIGTVTTLSPGSNATVTNSGTSSAAVFDFGIPQGAEGDPGEVVEQIVPIETTTTASRSYATDDYLVNSSGILVQATAAIALGATIDSTNTAAVNKTLSEALSSDIVTVKSRIQKVMINWDNNAGNPKVISNVPQGTVVVSGRGDVSIKGIGYVDRTGAITQLVAFSGINMSWSSNTLNVWTTVASTSDITIFIP